MLSGNFSWNYYHFIFEFLSKFYLLDMSNISNNIPLIVDECINNAPQFKDLLDYFNKDKREVLYIKPGYIYNIEILYYLSFLNIIPPNYRDISGIKYTDCLFNRQSIEFLRECLLQKKSERCFHKRIFISRKNASSRRKYNEDEVIGLFNKYDFKVFSPEDYSIPEQISLFNDAEFIAGTTGAAFTNILFCSNQCKILCFQSIEMDISIFSTIAKILGVDFQYFTAKDGLHQINDIHEEFTLNVKNLEDVLVQFLMK